MSILELMAAPFAECLVLVAIHTYLGIHVLKRRVIFVDLALAQIAALGTTVGFLFGIMPETPAALLFSMAFTFLGAAVFSLTRFRHERVPQEAIIGLTYAVSFALAVIVVDKTQGAEHLKDILVGNLLWVTWSDVAVAAGVYLAVGVVHFLCRKKFLLISDDPAAAYASGVRVRGWDFLFYFTFGVVIALSTRVAGVLLVFVFLVGPAILAFVLTTRLWLQLLIGWATGTVVTVVGLFLSWKADLPSGPAVIVMYGVVLVLAGIAVYLWRAGNRRKAVRNVLIGIAVTAAVATALWEGGRWLGESRIAVSDEARQVEAQVSADQVATESKVQDEHAQKRQAILSRVGTCVEAAEVERYLSSPGLEEWLQLAHAAMAGDSAAALRFAVIALADDETPLLYREEGLDLVREVTHDTFGYDTDSEASQNIAALGRICEGIRPMGSRREAPEGRDR